MEGAEVGVAGLSQLVFPFLLPWRFSFLEDSYKPTESVYLSVAERKLRVPPRHPTQLQSILPGNGQPAVVRGRQPVVEAAEVTPHPARARW